ncbi:Na+/H+ antiporter NhaD-like permease [Aciduliprofundum sp. MAR08-339]|uniref:SLC13 family permease n=1 Tax=Aciduliprofundum sp. (strain MAR08-339) TaxID=673860 RepID=UPI0002A4BDEF|nr:Na+/H+ antiporter NhaD-like permease [Aciduliprofundum sp. MAR08-339]
MEFKSLKKDYTLIASLLLLLIITLIAPNLISQYPYFINWNTWLTLAALFLITTTMRDSGYLDIVASKMIGKVKKERNLAVILIIISFFLSMIVTNDVTLLVLVPLTLSLQKYIAKDIRKMIIFEALAVNAGSALTPIGNPQNLYLWQIWGVGFLEFIYYLLPLSTLMLVVLLIFAFFSFPTKCMKKLNVQELWEKDRSLGIISISLLILLVVFMDLRLEMYLIPLVFLVYLIYGKKSYMHVDWALLIIFLLFFIDFNALGHISIINNFLSAQKMSGVNAFLYGALFSQFMSNVPSAILLGNFTTDFKELIYGVNIGGNGTIIASLANLIALRFVKDRRWMLQFHKYSLPYFIITLLIVMLIGVL